MTRLRLAARSLLWYRRTHLAVLAGVATAVAVLAGALLVGDSVRASLRELALARLGAVEAAVRSRHFFREQLAAALAAGGGRSAPLIALDGVADHEPSGRRAFSVQVYGVDERFWSLQGQPDPLAAAGAREALASRALVEELAAAPSDSLLLRVQAPGDVPGASLFGEREGLGRTLRVSLKGALPPDRLGEFALRASQRAVRAVFVPLGLLQRALRRPGGANVVVLAGARLDEPALAERLREAADLEDLGLRLRPLPGGTALSLESASALLDDAVVAAARAAAGELGLEPRPLLTYLANAIEAAGREVPYSLVTGLDDTAWTALAGGPPAPGAILLSDWAARDLAARPGDPLSLRYFLWHEDGRLGEERAGFTVAGVFPLAAADREMTPEYPGITESASLSDWDPPFPVDLAKVRPRDEEYWERHRGTPKAFVPLARARELWGHRLGELSALRFPMPRGEEPAAALARFAGALRRRLDPRQLGFEAIAARQEALLASRGTTDFDQYFVYFSFFLILSALLLAGLFFRLGVEQRLPEIGLLRALGFRPTGVRRQLVGEGLLLSLAGSLPGALGAAGFATLVLEALGRYGFDAVGTRELVLHADPETLATGALAGVLASTLAVALTLRGVLRREPRALLHGAREDAPARAGARRWSLGLGLLALAAAAGLALATSERRLDAVAGFFGSGALCLAGLLALAGRVLRSGGPGALPGGLLALGLRGAARRPGRSLLLVALIACATFVIVAVGAFRYHPPAVPGDPKSGTGGYTLVGESLLPLHHDPATAEGRAALNLDGPGSEALQGARFTRLRLRPGDDASCLNLYAPRAPRVLGAPDPFLRAGRFSFTASLAESADERANPWLLLARDTGDGTVPAIADQNSIQYVLHKSLGDVVEIDAPGVGRARLRLVAALRRSLFQSELIVGERQFLRLFPSEDGYRVLLLDAPRGSEAALSGLLESRLSDAGLDVQPAGERLARYLRVERVYIATFQMLGGLGLLLGTVGLATVILRNAAERRRELGLLRAVGYRRADLRTLVLAENATLLLLGLAIGGLCALLATWPAAAAHGARAPLPELAGLLLAVLATGVAVSRLAVGLVVRGEVLAALRTD